MLAKLVAALCATERISRTTPDARSLYLERIKQGRGWVCGRQQALQGRQADGHDACNRIRKSVENVFQQFNRLWTYYTQNLYDATRDPQLERRGLATL